MPTSLTSRRAARWSSLVVIPLVVTPLVVSPSGAASAVDAASAAPVRNSNGWAAFNDSSTTNVDTAVHPGVAQLADGRLVVAWRQSDNASGIASLYTTTVAPDGTVEAPVGHAPTGVGPDPEVLARPGGAEVIYVGDGSSGEFSGTNAYRLLVDRAGHVTGPGEGRYFAGNAGVDLPVDTALTADGETIVNQVRRWHTGLVAPSESEDPTYQPAWWPMYHVSIATAGDTTFLAHLATQTTTSDGKSIERGLYVGPIDATEDQLPQRLPGSWYGDKQVALEGSTTGVLWAAYCTGDDACDKLVLRDVTNGRSLTVPTGEYAAQITLSPAPGGRMWVAWQSGVSAISAVRTNKAGTRFGPVRRSAPFYAANNIRSIALDGRTGPADVVVNGRQQVWHRRYLVPLTVKATPSTWPVGRKQRVSFVVKDAGDSVPNALVTLAGRSCTTDATGTCSIVVPARSKPGKLVATVSRSGYETTPRTVRISLSPTVDAMTAPSSTARRPAPLPLLRAAHIGPAVAVTCVVALLSVGTDLPPVRAVVLTAAVLAGQLTVGWGNDLLDADRDRRVGRSDKPLATGELSPTLVLRCLVLAAVACVVLSFLNGWRSGLTHLVLGVAFGHLYNLWFKPTAWSWLPYAVAFGALPAVVTLAAEPPAWPPAWMLLTAATLGVAAHFLNTLPDLEADEATGIRGLPHRLGERASRLVATTLLLVGSVVAVLGPAGAPDGWALGALVVVAALAVLALVGQGKGPFYAAIAIALVDVTLLVVVAP